MIKNHGKKHLAGATLAVIAIALLGCATFTRSETATSANDATKSQTAPNASVQPTTGAPNATFSVTATGTAPLTYQWYFDPNTAKQPATTPQLAYQWVDPKAKAVVLADGTRVLTDDPALISDSTSSLASQLIGTWVLEKELGPKSSPSGVGIRMKNFTGTHWSIVQPDPKTGEIIFHQGGTYKIDGDKYFEHKDFAGEHNKGGIGKTGEFTLKVEGDTLTQTGVNNPWNEVWKRAK